MNIEEAVRVVDAHPDYRVLRKFQPVQSPWGEIGETIREGLYVDTETTGVDVRKDNIIELAYVPFQFDCETGDVVAIGQGKSFLNDPGRPLDDNIRSLTGITTEDVEGKSLPLEEITEDFSNASMIVAHNAGFDRKILERYFPDLAQVLWGCSQQDVPWRLAFGALSERLEAIALMPGGIFYDAHRALIDCQVGIHLLATIKDDAGDSAFAYLLNNARRDVIRVWAVGSPYSAKDLLRENGYRWNDGTDGRPKAWNKAVTEDTLEEELTFLRTKALAYPQITTTAALDRYSVRDR